MRASEIFRESTGNQLTGVVKHRAEYTYNWPFHSEKENTTAVAFNIQKSWLIDESIHIDIPTLSYWLKQDGYKFTLQYCAPLKLNRKYINKKSYT